MSFLRDPIWTFIGVLLAGAAICVTLWLRNRKALSYEVASDVPIVTVQHGTNNVVTEDIEIRYKGEPVHDVKLVVVRVWNSGNQPIVPSDHVKPITVTFWGKMLASDVVETSPASLKPEVITGGGIGPGYQAIAFRNLLLNPKDSVTIQALMTDFSGKVEVDARIVGVSAVREVSWRWINSSGLLSSISLGLAVGGLVLTIANAVFTTWVAPSLLPNPALQIALGLYVLIAFVVAITVSARIRKRGQ